MMEPEPQPNTGTDIEQPAVYICVSVYFTTTESELPDIAGIVRTFHSPLSIYVYPLASLRWTRTAPYYRNCYSTTIFNVSSQLKCLHS